VTVARAPIELAADQTENKEVSLDRNLGPGAIPGGAVIVARLQSALDAKAFITVASPSASPAAQHTVCEARRWS
jgi:hypothetical protein